MSDNKTAYLTQIRERAVMGDIMTEMLCCSHREVDTIIQMVEMHGIEVAEEARDYVNNSVDIWSFGAFVVGTHRRVIELLRSRISEEMATDLEEIVMDEEKYGRISFYKDCDVAVADIFADMCVNGTVADRIGELISYDVDFYGGRQDEPDMDKLIEGLAEMMERHGVRGHVRTKAKEFLTAVAMDAIDEVINEESPA